MRVYVAAPMSGYPQHNIPAIRAAGADLRSRGYEAVVPCEIDDVAERDWRLASENGEMTDELWAACLARDLVLIATCDALVTLPGWAKSRGALLEIYDAELLGIPVLRYGPNDPLLPVPITYINHAHLHRRELCPRPSSAFTRSTSRRKRRSNLSERTASLSTF